MVTRDNATENRFSTIAFPKHVKVSKCATRSNSYFSVKSHRFVVTSGIPVEPRTLVRTGNDGWGEHKNILIYIPTAVMEKLDIVKMGMTVVE